MGSVKRLVKGNEFGGAFYRPPDVSEFGFGAWRVSGSYSVRDLKDLRPAAETEHKAAALTMMTARFFEWLNQHYPEIPTCYEGLLDKSGHLADTDELLAKGETSNHVVMLLAHTPESYADGNLDRYRRALNDGKLQCGVADIEAIFRKGFPLGSSKFEDIFTSVGQRDKYLGLATYDETVKGLNEIRQVVRAQGMQCYPGLERILADAGLGTTIPNPGYILKNAVYDSTTKFEHGGDRKITPEEEQRFSGLSPTGYDLWINHMLPNLSQAQIEFAEAKGLLNIDGKVEVVSYQGNPVITDFCCTVDENRLMIPYAVDGVEWAIPSNKEIQRAVFKQAGVDFAIEDAKEQAYRASRRDEWHAYMPEALKERGIDLQAVSDYSCRLMSSAIVEVANRILDTRVFDAKPLDTWVKDFLPYASRIERQR